MNEASLELTEEQWLKVVEFWNSRPANNPPSLMELTKLIFGKEDIDGRSVEGRALRKKLAEAKLKPIIRGEERKGSLELTQEQQEYVKSNSATMSAVEIARVIFDNKALTNLNQETRSVAVFIKKNNLLTWKDVNQVPISGYKPPRTVEKVVEKINCYRHEKLNINNLNGKQKKDVKALLGYLNTYRYVHQINTYEEMRDRELFESEFIRCCYDKNDLTEEEVDQYILYCGEVVIGTSISARVEKLRKLLDETTEEDKRITLSLVEAINTSQTEYNQCMIRQNKLLDALKVKRSEKEGKAKEGAASILNLIQLWKDEESRKKLIALAQTKQSKLKEGIDELASMDELKAKILGLTADEALYG